MLIFKLKSRELLTKNYHSIDIFRLKDQSCEEIRYNPATFFWIERYLQFVFKYAAVI